MLLNLLTTETTTSNNKWTSVLMLVVLLAVFVGGSIYNRRTQKKKQDEMQKKLDAIKPGTKVKTIGGIMGVVVEVCEDDAFILETGSEASGKSYLKFDKQAVYQSDAVAEDKKDKETAENSKDAE